MYSELENADFYDLHGSSIAGKTVILRVDLNAPSHETGLLDDSKLKKTALSIASVVEIAKKVIVLAHIGSSPSESKGISVVNYLSYFESFFDQNVGFVPNPDPLKVGAFINASLSKKIWFVENIRQSHNEFNLNSGEAEAWAGLADVYINDCFSSIHRNHTSISGIPSKMEGIAGPYMSRELKEFKQLFVNTTKLGVVIAGSKHSTKSRLVSHFAKRAHVVCLGDVIAEHCDSKADNILRPSNWINDTSHSRNENVANSDLCSIALENFKDALVECDTVLWNGPLGVYEKSEGMRSTRDFANFCGYMLGKNATVVAGGGDTKAAIKLCNSESNFTRIYSAGGAMLSFFLYGSELPGLKDLKGRF